MANNPTTTILSTPAPGPAGNQATATYNVDQYLNHMGIPSNPYYTVAANSDGIRPTYSGGINGLVPVASCTDLFTITGSASKTIRVTRIEVSGIATTILDTTVRLLLRTTADTGGTSTAPAAYPHDSLSAAATATLAAYTANPTVNDGTNRLLRASKLLFNLAAPSAGSESGRLIWDAGDRPAQAFVLRGVAQQLAINLNGVSVAGGSVDISVEWTEDNS